MRRRSGPFVRSGLLRIYSREDFNEFGILWVEIYLFGRGDYRGDSVVYEISAKV